MTADLLNDRFDLNGQFQAFSGQNCLLVSHRLVKLSRCEGVELIGQHYLPWRDLMLAKTSLPGMPLIFPVSISSSRRSASLSQRSESSDSGRLPKLSTSECASRTRASG